MCASSWLIGLLRKSKQISLKIFVIREVWRGETKEVDIITPSIRQTSGTSSSGLRVTTFSSVSLFVDDSVGEDGKAFGMSGFVLTGEGILWISDPSIAISEFFRKSTWPLAICALVRLRIIAVFLSLRFVTMFLYLA